MTVGKGNEQLRRLLFNPPVLYYLFIYSTEAIFPSFLDDDPKTAEIISKIIFLTEDVKIKDPTILGQIREV
ncbi:DUF7737 domain-containing protein [Pelotomaculum terephthalicicum]|uniref:DUF7737 domain-containing protein n=1 Tax=Pelotomaculum terephthalicicum TaxID=206393 RepID=UPI00406B9143